MLMFVAGDPKEFFARLYHHMQDKIKNCTKYCIICDKQLDYVGLKPAVCDNPLCMFRYLCSLSVVLSSSLALCVLTGCSYMQYGLGEDIGLFVQRNPEVVDLLISLTAAAAQGDIKRFQPFPAGVEARICAHGVRRERERGREEGGVADRRAQSRRGRGARC
jgi:hypothetical protein